MKLPVPSDHIWVSSDMHFRHTNILKYAKRPFINVEEMNQVLIDNHNRMVAPDDYWIHLGDFVFGQNKVAATKEFLSQMNGKKIMLFGNHDPYFQAEEVGAEVARSYIEIFTKVGGKNAMFVCMHYPIYQWNRRDAFSIMLHGHSHGGLNPTYYENNLAMDVGVDANNYHPITLQDIFYRMQEKKSKIVIATQDHHGESNGVF